MSEFTGKSADARSREQIIQLNSLGRQWLLAMHAALRTMQFHKTDNQIFDQPLAVLVKNGSAMIRLEGKADFRIIEDQFFINGLWLKPIMSEKELIYSIADQLRQAGVGGIAFNAPPTDRDLRIFLQVYNAYRGAPEDRVLTLNQELSRAGVGKIELQRVTTIREIPEKDLPLPLVAYNSVKNYAKALLVLKEFTACGSVDEQITVLRKAQRLVCDLVDISEKAPRLLTLLSLLKSIDSYFFHHGPNVCILSLLVAREMGMGRVDMVDLGLAALLHDVGKIKIPEALLDKTEPLSSEEWAVIRHHPIESAKTYLALGYLNRSVAERILVGFQHHLASKSPEAYPKPRRPMKISMMSSIVSVCVMYDALTSDKPYRGRFTPYQAVRILAAESARGRFSKGEVSALLRVLGPVPFGTWVRFQTGEEGLVVAAGSQAPTPPFPLVFVPGSDGKKEKWIDSSAVEEQTRRPISFVAKKASLEQLHLSLAAALRTGQSVLY